ncbi:Ribosomal lysine N-methyltransferase 4 [Teratosphaeria destructans]|uniref:Ribosomal lysine N-methyltransferase 4 n=1 Tax=Teratosphaeria destructans TaxID=418781 RepID=A0A9W7SYE2_9PEZI|nr:Ribosomal lysine N-methyltransferase 4 [Teratosphaeria destructans]
MADDMEVDDLEGRSNSFLNWLKQSATTISTKIQLADLRDQSAGRGVLAKQDIAEDEVLFTIRRSSILTVDNSELPGDVKKQLDDPWLSLIVAMIYEHQLGGDSRWKAYFDVLPTEFDTPMFWSDEELEYLRGSAVKEKIGKTSADEAFSTKIIPLLGQHAKVFRLDGMSNQQLLELCHRMGSTIMAYAFDLETSDLERSSSKHGEDGWEEDEEESQALSKGMVPLADMLNADADRNNARLFYEEDKVVMKSIKPIKAGEEIFNDYGPLPSADVLRRYGYTTPNYEKYDVVEVSLDFIKDHVKDGPQKLQEQDLDERIRYLDEQGVVDDAFDISRADNEDGQFPDELCMLFNTLALSRDEFAKLKKKDKLPRSELEPAAARLLSDICQERLTTYCQWSEEEFKTLDTDNSKTARRKRMALQVLKGEKEVLGEAILALSNQFPQTVNSSKRKAGNEDAVNGKKPRAG